MITTEEYNDLLDRIKAIEEWIQDAEEFGELLYANEEWILPEIEMMRDKKRDN